ncbi:MAG: nucleotide exchange factor GrpE [Acidiferrobacterales bacterium]
MSRKKQTGKNPARKSAPATTDSQPPEPSTAEVAGARPAPVGARASATQPVEQIQADDQLRTELEAAHARSAEERDKFLRAKAEAENVRRRAEVDVANARKFGVERFAAELLAVRDSLELARTVDIRQENETALEKMHEGLDLTLRLMDKVFEKFALTVIDPQNKKFDPERHQAMSIVESDKVAPGHVVQVVQKGYLLHDRLLRPAMVVVAKTGCEDSKDINP